MTFRDFVYRLLMMTRFVRFLSASIEFNRDELVLTEVPPMAVNVVNTPVNPTPAIQVLLSTVIVL